MVTLTIGNLFMSVFGGIGMIMLPYDLINEYIYRPKYIDKNAWTRRQRVLLPMLVKLREEGKRLEKEAIQVELMRGLTGYVRRYAFSKKMTVWQTRTLMAEKEFEKLQDQADFNNRVEPCYYIWQLLKGVFVLVYTCLFAYLLTLNVLGALGQQATQRFDPLYWLDAAVLEM